jgi:hypothetical protein
MSALGQKRTLAGDQRMSALGQKRTLEGLGERPHVGEDHDQGAPTSLK